MFLDASLTFNSALGTPQAIAATANSAAIIDVTGAGSGNLPRMVGGYPALNNDLGLDMGSGDGVANPYLVVQVSTAGTGTGTLTVTLQAAPDNGSGSPGTYTVLATSAAYVGTALVAGTQIVMDVPNDPAIAQPRFYQVVYTVSGTLTASVLAFVTLNAPDSLKGIQYNSNFVAA
jgi:hypothetical protein